MLTLSCVLPCCCAFNAVVSFSECVEADAGRDIAVGNRGVRESSVYLVCTSSCGTCHEASGPKGIGAEITVPVISRVDIREWAQDSTCWVGTRVCLCKAKVTLDGHINELATRNFNILESNFHQRSRQRANQAARVIKDRVC
jgi:hypothetical protein